MTRALADSYRAELVRAARKGAGFDPATGEPVAWATLEPVNVTWYQHAMAYVDMKWVRLAWRDWLIWEVDGLALLAGSGVAGRRFLLAG
jgi:hypothetical protein